MRDMTSRKASRSAKVCSGTRTLSPSGRGPSPAWQIDRGNFALSKKPSGVLSTQPSTMLAFGIA